MDSFSKQHQITSTEIQITTCRNRGYALMKKSAKPFVLISLFCLWLDGIPTFGIDLPFVSALQPHYLIHLNGYGIFEGFTCAIQKISIQKHPVNKTLMYVNNLTTQFSK